MEKRGEALHEARNRVAELTKEGRFKAGPMMRKIGKEVAIDLAKEAAKDKIAEYFEGEAWLKNYEADVACTIAVRIASRAASVYWDLVDAQEALGSARDAIKTRLDEKNNLDVDPEVNGTFSESDKLTIGVALAGKKKRTLSVMLGGKSAKLESEPQPALRYISTYSLDPKGLTATKAASGSRAKLLIEVNG